MADYASFVALAQRMIAKRGRTVSVQAFGKPDAAGATPWKATGGTAPLLWSSDQPAVALPVAGSNLSKIITNKDLLKSVSEVLLIAPADGVALAEATAVIDRGTKLTLEWVQVLEPGDTPCLYVYGVKR